MKEASAELKITVQVSSKLLQDKGGNSFQIPILGTWCRHTGALGHCVHCDGAR